MSDPAFIIVGLIYFGMPFFAIYMRRDVMISRVVWITWGVLTIALFMAVIFSTAPLEPIR